MTIFSHIAKKMTLVSQLSAGGYRPALVSSPVTGILGNDCRHCSVGIETTTGHAKLASSPGPISQFFNVAR